MSARLKTARYYRLPITHPNIDVSVAVTIIAALVVAVVTVGGVIFFQEAISTRKVTGIILAIIAIILLRPGT